MTLRRVGLAAAAAGVGIALWLGTDWSVVGRAGAALAERPLPLVAALAAYTVAFVLRAAAWGPLLPTPVSLGRRFRAILAMLAVNHALPGPVGELARARLVSAPEPAGAGPLPAPAGPSLAPQSAVHAAKSGAIRRFLPHEPGDGPDQPAATAADAATDAAGMGFRADQPAADAAAAADAGMGFRAALLSVAAARVVDVGALAVLAVAAAALAGEAPTWLRMLAPAAAILPFVAWALARRRGAVLSAAQAAEVAAWALPSWALEAGVILVVARAAGVELSPAAAMLATCGGVLAQVAAVLPGGVGTYEAGVSSVLVPLGVPLGEAVGVATTAHTVKFGFAFAAGGLALAWPRVMATFARVHRSRSGPAGEPLVRNEAAQARRAAVDVRP